MADTLTPPSTSARRAASQRHERARTTNSDGHHQPRPAALVGIAVAAWTVALGLAVLICLTLAAWVTATYHDDAIRPALAAAVQAWLLAQHAAIGLGSGSVSIAPLGLTFFLATLLVHAGRQVVRLSGARDLLGAVTAASVLALPYAVIAALLTKAAEVGQVTVSPLRALAGAFVLAFVCALFGSLRETGQIEPLLDRMPDDVRAALRAGLTASAIVVGVGAIAVVLGLAAHAGRASQLASSLHGGFSGAVLMALICLAFTPNVVIWASAYALGPGFAVGAHTSVALGGVHVGAVPAVPLLAPLPDSGAAPLASWLMLTGPIAAGIVAGWLIARTQPQGSVAAEAPWWVRYRLPTAAWGFLAGTTCAAALGLLAGLSAGSLGGGRMSQLGPSPWWVLLAAVAEVGVLAAVTIWLLGWRSLRVLAAAAQAPAA
ncbi:MAG: cell division protein PerM [Acidothermaceae bacterium]